MWRNGGRFCSVMSRSSTSLEATGFAMYVDRMYGLLTDWKTLSFTVLPDNSETWRRQCNGMGMFFACGLGPIHRIDGIMGRFMYNNFLKDVMLPYAEWNMPLKWIFQQDNNPKHTVQVVKQWYKDKQTVVVDWLP